MTNDNRIGRACWMTDEGFESAQRHERISKKRKPYRDQRQKIYLLEVRLRAEICMLMTGAIICVVCFLMPPPSSLDFFHRRGEESAFLTAQWGRWTGLSLAGLGLIGGIFTLRRLSKLKD